MTTPKPEHREGHGDNCFDLLLDSNTHLFVSPEMYCSCEGGDDECEYVNDQVYAELMGWV